MLSRVVRLLALQIAEVKLFYAVYQLLLLVDY